MKLYIGNLSRSVSEQDLQELFATYGEVKSANVIKDKFSGESRGFGFVEMGDDAAAQNAIAELTGKDFQGRPLRVSEAHERTAGGNGGGRGGFGGNRGGFGGSRGGNGGGRGGFGGSRGPRRDSW